MDNPKKMMSLEALVNKKTVESKNQVAPATTTPGVAAKEKPVLKSTVFSKVAKSKPQKPFDNNGNKTPRNGGSLFLWLAIIVMVGVAAFGSYFFLQRSAVNAELNQLNQEVEQINQDLEQLDTERLDALKKSLDTVEVIQRQEIPWSNVIAKIVDLTPKDENGQPTIIFSSFSGGSAGKLNMNATTNPARGTEIASEVFADVATLIKTFNESRVFAKGFVPSIAKGLTEDGSVVLSFSFLTDYEPKAKIKRR